MSLGVEGCLVLQGAEEVETICGAFSTLLPRYLDSGQKHCLHLEGAPPKEMSGVGCLLTLFHARRNMYFLFSLGQGFLI